MDLAGGVVLDEERERPTFWRFWRHLPPKGQIGLYLSGRYSKPLLEYVYGTIDLTQFTRALDRVNNFEKAPWCSSSGCTSAVTYRKTGWSHSRTTR